MRTSTSNMMENGVMALSMVYCSIYIIIVIYMCIIGHGKLMMEDGSYYEGSFVKGEIEGHGYRVFGNTGSTYTGMDI